MGIGYLTVRVDTADGALPVPNARVTVKTPNGDILYETYADADGATETFPLTSPDKELTLQEDYDNAAYSIADVEVSAPGYVTKHIRDVEIVDTQTTILPVHMEPLANEPSPVTDEDVTIPPVGLLVEEPFAKATPPADGQTPPRADDRVLSQVTIPEYITVHLGSPNDSSARNVRVRFADYIKNVVSSEIYSTWPYNSLVANIHAIVTFALNRIYTEWYRSRGYPFDITNSTAYDQYYRDGGPVFENVSNIVDGIFNVYAKRNGQANPFFTQFCNGSTVTCNGLSQWGTVTLANQGLSPLDILRYYYPKDLELATSNNISNVLTSYPGTALRQGSQGEDVRKIQNYLNRIRKNYPLIPAIANPNGYFGPDTENAVRTFQQVFNLTADGVVGRNTWNRISYIYTAVARLGELDSEGVYENIGSTPPNAVLSQGARGSDVSELQYLLNAISTYYPSVPYVTQDGVFGPNTRNAVVEFQKTFGLTRDGVVGPATWSKLYSVYQGITGNVTNPPSEVTPAYPGTLLKEGSRGENVRLMQRYLSDLRATYPSLPAISVDGVFGPNTKAAVIAFQRAFGLGADGVIGPLTWAAIVSRHG